MIWAKERPTSRAWHSEGPVDWMTLVLAEDPCDYWRGNLRGQRQRHLLPSRRQINRWFCLPLRIFQASLSRSDLISLRHRLNRRDIAQVIPIL
eukprot:9289414-Pyramimonas_sp.AAC.1